MSHTVHIHSLRWQAAAGVYQLGTIAAHGQVARNPKCLPRPRGDRCKEQEMAAGPVATLQKIEADLAETRMALGFWQNVPTWDTLLGAHT